MLLHQVSETVARLGRLGETGAVQVLDPGSQNNPIHGVQRQNYT